jgi:anion-transporting  ArsA/GET3 family ATPase
MSRIIGLLGKSSAEHLTLAIATAHWFAQRQNRVLLLVHAAHPLSEDLIQSVRADTQTPFQIAQLQTTVLLDQVSDEIKQWGMSYLAGAMPVDIYPGELLVLPGFSHVLTFNALRQYYQSADYDVIVYAGQNNLETLRMLGIPTLLDWYFQRFHRLLNLSDLSKLAESLGGPLASALLTANVDQRKIQQTLDQVRSWIAEGITVTDQAVQTYLLATSDEWALAEARWLWGNAQQMHLKIHGLLVHPIQSAELLGRLEPFVPLAVHALPTLQNWNALLPSLPNFDQVPTVPQPVEIDVNHRQVRVFLPGFTKQQVKLTQFGKSLTVEAGDQRRNIFLPSELQDLTVSSGKFEDQYLIISF